MADKDRVSAAAPATSPSLRGYLVTCLHQRINELVTAWGTSRSASGGRACKRKALRRLARRMLGLALALGLLQADPRPVCASSVPFGSLLSVTTSFPGAGSVTAADLDGDGDLDIVGSGRTANQINWWENDGALSIAPTFTNVHAIASGLSIEVPTQVITADIDGDGDLDVIGAASTGALVNWWENRLRQSQGFSVHSVATGFLGAFGLAAADMDGDGDLDLVGTAVQSSDVTWWENVGTPGNGSSFTAHTIDGSFSGSLGLAVIDLDEDGDPDVLATASSGGDVTWWENVGAPGNASSFSAHTIDGNFAGAHAVAAADLDGDGDLDVIAGGNGSTPLKWWENSGAPASTGFTAHTIAGSFTGAYDVQVSDVDGDGDLDLVAAAFQSNAVTWFENNGAGSFSSHGISSTLNGPYDLAIADLDGDGDMDVLSAAAGANSVNWWRNETIHRSALFPSTFAHTMDPAFTGVDSVVEADLDADGDLDVVATQSTSSAVSWLENKLPQGLGFQGHPVETSFNGATDAAVADVDGDGDLDVIGAGYFAGLAWWANDGTPSNGGWIAHTLDGTFSKAYSVAAVDVDGDGDMDVVAAAYDESVVLPFEVSWFQNNGSGSFTRRVIDNSFPGAIDIRTADLNRDGEPDVLATSRLNQEIRWYQNSGAATPTFAAHTVVTGFITARAAVVTHLDRDGDLDIVGASFGGSGIKWFESDDSNSTNVVYTAHSIATTAGFTILSSDLDGDGDLDVIRADFSGAFDWWENDGTPANGGFAQNTIGAGGFAGRDLASADLDRDGDLDLIDVGTGTNNTAVWWENRGGQFALPTVVTAPGTLQQGQTDDVLKITAIHRGRTGDSPMELSTLQLLFEKPGPTAMSDAEANALIQNLYIYLDNGSGVFDSGTDAKIATIGSLTLSSGVQTVSFAPGDPNVNVTHGTPRVYFVVVELTANAASQPVNRFRVTHLTASTSTAQDAVGAVPLTLEYLANVASGFVQAIAPSPTPTATLSPSATVTRTPTGGSSTATPTASGTPDGPSGTPTPTITPGGPTPTPTRTITPGGPTPTPTRTITPGGPTPTPTPPVGTKVNGEMPPWAMLALGASGLLAWLRRRVRSGPPAAG